MRFLFLAFCSLLAACADRIEAPIIPAALNAGSIESVFVATNRRQEDDGIFGIGRSPIMRLFDMKISIPGERRVGEISDGRKKPKPGKDFVIAERNEILSEASFRSSFRAELALAPTRDTVVYVHGFNNSFADAAFRMAQLTHDLEIPGPVVSFAWPSRGNPLGYQYDADSSLYSRDSLERLLRMVKGAGVDRIVLVAHSMGSNLTLETLRQIELQMPGWVAQNIAGVMLISPDVNMDVFRSQTAVFDPWPQPFVVFGSKKDRALILSGRLRGEDRQLGRIPEDEDLSDLPIEFVDVTEFSDGDRLNHFVAGSSESFIRLVRANEQLDDAFLRGKTGASASLLGGRRISGKVVRLQPETGVR